MTRCKDGRYKWICSRGRVISRDSEGRALRMVGTTTDITSMRGMSERLRESVNLVTNLTNEVPGLVFQCRRLPDGRMSFPYASAGIAEIYELTPDAVANLRAPIFEEKVIDHLLGTINVTDKKVTKEELMAEDEAGEETAKPAKKAAPKKAAKKKADSAESEE